MAVGISDRAHELLQAIRELRVVLLPRAFVQVEHLDREVDALDGRVRIRLLHDVLLAKDADVVLEKQMPAPIAVDVPETDAMPRHVGPACGKARHSFGGRRRRDP